MNLQNSGKPRNSGRIPGDHTFRNCGVLLYYQGFFPTGVWVPGIIFVLISIVNIIGEASLKCIKALWKTRINFLLRDKRPIKSSDLKKINKKVYNLTFLQFFRKKYFFFQKKHLKWIQTAVHSTLRYSKRLKIQVKTVSNESLLDGTKKFWVSAFGLSKNLKSMAMHLLRVWVNYKFMIGSSRMVVVHLVPG